MKYFILFAVIFAVASPVTAFAEQKQVTSRVMKGLPVMEGLCEQTPVYDNATGLPANPNQTSFTFNGRDKQVRTYYSQQFRDDGYTNPDPMKPDTYVNDDGDTVIVSTTYVNGQTIVTITKHPHDEQPAAPQEQPAEAQPQETYQAQPQPQQDTYEFDPSKE